MKKLVLFAAALAALVACNKEEGVGTDSFVKGQKVTLTVSAPSTTKITSAQNGDKIDFTWDDGDKIRVNVGKASATFILKEGAGSGKATFEGTMPEGGSTFDVTYPETVDVPDITSQTYTEGGEPLTKNKMSFSATGCTLGSDFELAGTKALLRLNLWGTSQTIGKIVITNTSLEAAITLNISPAVTLPETEATAKAFFIIVPNGSSKFTAEIYDNAATPAKICSFTPSAAQTFTNGKIRNMPAKEVKASVPVLLPGEFSVSATKKVKFTRGNLYYSTSDNAYHIEDAQNVTYGTLGQTKYDATHVCLFYWANIVDWQATSTQPWAQSYSYSTRSSSDTFFCGVDNAMTVDGQSGLYALTGGSSGEWYYLLSTRAKSSKLRNYGVSVTTNVGTVTNCLVIAPDGYTKTLADSYSAEEWATAESAGLVCLPASGERDGTSLSDNGSLGRYWSPTPKSDSEGYNLGVSSFSPTLNGYSPRSTGCSIRLVHTVSE